MAVKKKALKYLLVMTIMMIMSKSSGAVKMKLDSWAKIPESRIDKMNRYRLPNNTIPRSYDIHIEAFMDKEMLSWNGAISIELDVIDPTTIMTLHAYKNLRFVEYETELVDFYGLSMRPIKHNRYEVLEFLALEFDREIAIGNYTLNLQFSGEETCCFIGLFKHQIAGIRPVAATLFEPTAARRAFPCWDEPGLKAHFRLSIEHYPNYKAMSNMPAISSITLPTGSAITIFEETPLMSTYLLNFVIYTDYRNISNEHGNVTILTKLPLEDIKYLLDLSPKVIKVMESYTGVSFGFPRIGSVVLPFHPTYATEHWGLVTYHEETMNADKNLLTTTQNDTAHLLVAHELSHSWFGNRVTPLWWNDLWLNEGFAAYFQYYIMDQINDNWGGVELFVLSNNQETAFPTDTDDKISIKTIPITEHEIVRQFKSSTYAKGAAIIHMFRNVLGDNAFRAGIQKYMAKNSFKSVVTDDLIEALQEAHMEDNNKKIAFNLKVMISPWLENKGYPVLKITRNYTSGNTTVLQRSNTVNGVNDNWCIPFTYATKSNPNFTSTIPIGWVNLKKSRGQIFGVDKADWIIVNVQASGYYRVNYDDKNWNRIANYLDTDNYKNIHVLNRAQLISDAFYLAQSEPDSYYYNFFNIIKYLSREDEYLPWRAAHYAITLIGDSLPSSSEANRLFQNHILDMMEGFVEKIGFEPSENDDHYKKLSRMDVINWACVNGNQQCADYSARKIKEYAKDPIKNQLHPDTRRWVFCAGLRGLNNDESIKFSSWAYVNVRDLLIDSIGCTKNHEIHKALLYSSIMKNGVGDPRETAEILRILLASSQENFNYAIDFFIEHHAALNHSIVNDEWFEISDILEDILVEVKTTEQLEKFNEIFKLDVILKDTKIPQSVMMIAGKRNIARHEASIKRFLKCWDKFISTYNSLDDDLSIDFVPMSEINE